MFPTFLLKYRYTETVAKRVVEAAREYLAADVPLGRYLADQLQIPTALAGGGKFRTLSPTTHTQTNAEIIKKFIDIEVAVTEYDRNQWEIELWRGSKTTTGWSCDFIKKSGTLIFLTYQIQALKKII